MLYKKHHYGITALTVALFFLLLILHSADTASLAIKTATPLVPLAALVAFSFFSSPPKAFTVGLIVGAALDSVVSRAYCFNTIVLSVLCLGICLSANNLFNKNIRAAAVLSLLAAVIYFSAYWLIFHCFTADVKQSMDYLLSYALPSAVYTAVFIFPFYFIFKYFERVKSH